MRSLPVFTLIIFASTIGCNEASTPSVKNVSDTVFTKNNFDSTRESVAATKAVYNFLNWYLKVADSIISPQMVNNAFGGEYDTTKFYSVNFVETEKYLSKLEHTGYISQHYLNYWRSYFKEADENFKKNPENEGPPAYFDYDFVMLGQDIIDRKELQEAKAKANVSFYDSSKALVLMPFNENDKMQYFLSNNNGKWQIDSIGREPNN
jgi:hypothetical protein